MTHPPLSLIAAVARNGVIGKDNLLPWHLPEDLQHFKRVTLGHPVIMGRKTWESLPSKFSPLPGRLNIVVSRDPRWQAPGARHAASLHDALGHAQGAEQAFVIGGAQLYAAALPLAERLVLTELHRDYEGDAHFPAWDRREFHETSRQPHPAAGPHAIGYDFVTYQRQH